MAPAASSLSLQLPTFTPLEPLTKGTNLPEVPPEELLPPPPLIKKSATAPLLSRPATTEASKPKDNEASAGETRNSSSPPSSPNKPASVRRFLSRVSLNSNFTDDKNSILSGSLSPDGNVKPKKKHWWSRSSKGSVSSKSSAGSKRHSMMPAVGGSVNGSIISSNGRFSPLPPLPPTPKSQPVSNMPPPPRLPDDMFGKDLSSMDDDMFSNFNTGSGSVSGDSKVKK